MKTTTLEDAKIFVTDYKSYNEGKQFEHGHWLDLGGFSDVDELNEYLREHFQKAGIEDPEVMITDFEGFPKKFYSESYDSSLMAELFEYFKLLKDCYNPEALAAYIEAGYNAEDFDEAFAGEYDDDEDFAYSLADDLGLIDEKAAWPNNCIDWGRAARDLMQDYDYFEIDGYYFRCL